MGYAICRIEKITSDIELSDENFLVEGAEFKIYLLSKLDLDPDCTYVDVMNKYYIYAL